MQLIILGSCVHFGKSFCQNLLFASSVLSDNEERELGQDGLPIFYS